MNQYRCNECSREFYTDAQRKEHLWLRHGEKKGWDKKKVLYPRPTVRAGAGEFERAWFELNQKLLLLEDQAAEYQEKAEVLHDEMTVLQKLGKLDHQGKGKSTPTKVTAANRAPAKAKNKGKKVTPKKFNELMGGLCRDGSKGRPSQPADKPYWDSKHGKWTDNPKFASKGTAGICEMHQAFGIPKKKAAPKKGRELSPRNMAALGLRSPVTEVEEPAGPD